MTDTDIVKRLRALAAALAQGEWVALTTTCSTAADEIERLRKERDSARRMYCSEVARGGTSPASVADSLGWDFGDGQSNA
jgi:hypothetical protein